MEIEMMIESRKLFFVPRRFTVTFLSLWIFQACGLLVAVGQIQPTSAPPRIEVHFSPHNGCTDAIVHEIDAATSVIVVQAYKFNSPEIADALIRAQKERKVSVTVLVDGSTERRPNKTILRLVGGGMCVKTDALHKIAHNKVIVIDGKVVVTGSFNFTVEAERYHAENVLVIRDPSLAAEYDKNWHLHDGHSRPFKRATD